MNSATTTKASGRRPAPARGGLKYLITAATAAVVVGGWGLIAENPVNTAGVVSAAPPAAQTTVLQSAPALTQPGRAAQPAAPQIVPATGLRPVTLPQPRIRTRSSR